MRAQATARYIRQSPYKVRAVLNLVRGQSVSEARTVLRFTNRKAAGTISKVLESAVANAEHNMALDVEELHIATAFADEGPTLKRHRPRARGRSAGISKRTSHVTIVVADDTENEEN